MGWLDGENKDRTLNEQRRLGFSFSNCFSRPLGVEPPGALLLSSAGGNMFLKLKLTSFRKQMDLHKYTCASDV